MHSSVFMQKSLVEEIFYLTENTSWLGAPGEQATHIWHTRAGIQHNAYSLSVHSININIGTIYTKKYY